MASLTTMTVPCTGNKFRESVLNVESLFPGS